MQKSFYQSPENVDMTFARANHNVRRQARDFLYAEILEVARLRAGMHEKYEGVIVTTSSSAPRASWVEEDYVLSPETIHGGPIFIGGVVPAIEGTHISEDWSRWNADAWLALDTQVINPMCLSLHEHPKFEGWQLGVDTLAGQMYQCREALMLAEHIVITIDTTMSEFTRPQRELSVVELIERFRENTKSAAFFR